MDLGDTGDELGQDDRLAQPGAAEQADLAAADERGEQVDDLDARLEDLGLGREVLEERWIAVDRPALAGGEVAAPVDRFTEQVEHPAEGLLADRHAHRTARVNHGHPAHQAVGRPERDAAHPVPAELLLHFAREPDLDPFLIGVDFQGVVDVGQVALFELGVKRRADHLGNPSGCGRCGHSLSPDRLMIECKGYQADTKETENRLTPHTNPKRARMSLPSAFGFVSIGFCGAKRVKLFTACSFVSSRSLLEWRAPADQLGELAGDLQLPSQVVQDG